MTHYLTQDRALLGYFGLRSSLWLARVATPAELKLLGRGGTKCVLLLEKDRHADGPMPGLQACRLCRAVRQDPWELQEGGEVGLPCKLLVYPLLLAAGKLGGYGHPFPRADACCFPILHSAPVPCAPLRLKMSSSHRSLQGSAASALLSRHGPVCCSSHTASSPCWAFSSWSHSASSLRFAPPRRAGLGQSQAPAQTRSSATDLPRDCRQDPELSCNRQVPFSLLL